MSNDWIVVFAVVCAAIGFIAGVLVAIPPRRRVQRPLAPHWTHERTKTVSHPAMEVAQKSRRGRK